LELFLRWKEFVVNINVNIREKKYDNKYEIGIKKQTFGCHGFLSAKLFL